jgi:hypothetical protein
LIFDDPAELEKLQRPVMVRSGRGPFKPTRPRRGGAMHEIFFENLRNPARIRLAGIMRQFCPSQVYSARRDREKIQYTVALIDSASLKKYFSPDPESWRKRQVCSGASK